MQLKSSIYVYRTHGIPGWRHEQCLSWHCSNLHYPCVALAAHPYTPAFWSTGNICW